MSSAAEIGHVQQAPAGLRVVGGPGAATRAAMRPGARFAYAQQLGNLGLILIMSLPAIVGVGAGAMRLTFPVMAFIIGAVLLTRGRFSQYVTFCIWLFILTPFVRRVVDLQAGWESLNLLMLAPYAACLFGFGTFAYALASESASQVPKRTAFLILIAVVTFGFLNAVVRGKVFAAGFDFLRWAVPISFALLIIINQRFSDDVRAEFVKLNILAVPIVGFYGVFQYMTAPRWDAFWMENCGMLTIGLPVPYQIRVFGTMNSPGSFATYLTTAIVVLFVARSPLRWIGIAAGSMALALTLSRTAWLGCFIATGILMAFAPLRARFTIVGFATAAVFALPLLLVVPEAYRTLEKRFDTLSQISGDGSINDRSTDYQIFQNQSSTLILGEGLAVSGAYAGYADNGPVRIIDGGPIETITALGVFGGLAYYLCVAAVAFDGLRRRAADPSQAGLFIAFKALVVVGLLTQASGSTTIGETGILFWTALGLLLARAGSPPSALAPGRGADGRIGLAREPP